MPTESMGCTKTVLTTPFWGVRMLCSIFMASTTQTSSPVETRSPGRTKMEMTVPGMGERIMLSCGINAAEERGGGGASTPGEGGRPRRGLAGGGGSPSTSTWMVSPSTITSTGEWLRSPTCTVYHRSPTFMRKVVIANPYSPKYGKGAVLGGRRPARDWPGTPTDHGTEHP